ncbi:PREDICTED: kinesin [Prunus dulcis]|uniref:PREDICTED: kinesin n=1 Tax=Prunus dulcis TaxID=3755 RepID=A0A5E4GAJ8_PRUDU|nr:PREDICTED: kinesin [Prunus dulcis]
MLQLMEEKQVLLDKNKRFTMGGTGESDCVIELPPCLTSEKNESTPPPIDFEKSFTGRPEGVQKKLPSSNYGGENERLSRMALRLLQEVLLLTTVPETDLKPVPSARDVKDFGLDPIHSDEESPSMWPSEFNRLQREIIELWEACNVSLVHRTSFSYLKNFLYSTKDENSQLKAIDFGLSDFAKPGLMVQIMAVLALIPPKEDSRMRVSFESR